MPMPIPLYTLDTPPSPGIPPWHPGHHPQQHLLFPRTSSKHEPGSFGACGRACRLMILLQAGGLSGAGLQSLSSALRMLRVVLFTWGPPGGKVSTLRHTPWSSSSTLGLLVGSASSCAINMPEGEQVQV